MNRIDAIRIRGFRSLADVELTGLPDTTVLIGANGSGKSNFIRFFEMVSWMLRSHQLREFVAKHGGASDQLFGGSHRTNRMEAELSLRTDAGRNDYRFVLAHAHPDRFVFHRGGIPVQQCRTFPFQPRPQWRPLGSRSRGGANRRIRTNWAVAIASIARPLRWSSTCCETARPFSFTTRPIVRTSRDALGCRRQQ